MTVVVYRDGVMAADTAAWSGGCQMGPVRKVVGTADGRLFGFCGTYASVCKFIEWIEGGEEGEMPLPLRDRDEQSDFCVLVSYPDGRVRQLEHSGWEDLTGWQYVALGAGTAVAYGALWQGATAAQAVQAALAHASGVGGTVQAVMR